ncbi:MAG: type II secretion system protein GspL [Gammaproteobacteria bacterium]|jgi:general secretion pathway protein L|nr:type II secretion system protein GspL [Gammaproteobacteria bacterium]
MADTMLLRRLRGAPDRYEWLPISAAVEDETRADAEPGSLDEAAAACAGCRTVVLAPGEDMLLTAVNIPARNRQRLLQALPYALEERIAQDVEQMHFAPGVRRADGSVPVAVLERELIDRWLGELREAGIEPARMIPDVLALPYQPGDWTLAIDGGVALLRTAPQSGLAIEIDSLAALLAAALEEAGDARPERLHVHAPQSGIADFEALATMGLEVIAHPQADSALAMMAPQATTGEAIDLLQADYTRRERLGGNWRRWRPAAITFAVLVAVNLGVLIYDQLRLSRQSAQLQADVEAIFRQTFPETQRVVDPRVQMERGLASLHRGGGESGGFLNLMRDVSETLGSSSGVVIQRIAYQDRRLDISMHVPDLQQLDTMVRRLGEQGGVVAEIQSANAVGERVEARLQVRPRQ